MHRFGLLLAVAILLTGCAGNPFLREKPRPEPQLICPAWKDSAIGRKGKLADEIEAAPESAVWPDVLLSDMSIKDQLIAAGCGPA